MQQPDPQNDGPGDGADKASSLANICSLWGDGDMDTEGLSFYEFSQPASQAPTNALPPQIIRRSAEKFADCAES